MKKLVILGFDGTIADTSPGILHCFNATATAMGYQPVDHDALFGVIGIPLKKGFEKLFKMNEDEIIYAANNYSKLYSQKGKKMVTFYKGIVDSLEKLRDNGYKIAIATLKHKMFTSDIIKTHEIADLFDAVCATDVGTNLNKSDLLQQACEMTGIDIADSVFIGDGSGDAEAAEKIGMDFIAALYGFDFRTKEDTEKYNCVACLNSADEIANKVLMLQNLNK